MKYLNLITQEESTTIKIPKEFTEEECKIFISGILSGEIKANSCIINENDNILNILGFGANIEDTINNDILDIIDDRFGWRQYLDFNNNYYYVNKYWNIIKDFLNN